MVGETNISVLLRGMTPELDATPYGIVVADQARPLEATQAFALIQEQEGQTIVAPSAVLAQAGYPDTDRWARVTLQIHSSLEAVGLTAAFAAALGEVNVSANVIAGFYHDHIFVQWDKRHAAMEALLKLSKSN